MTQQILIIEDDFGTRRLFQLVLERAGYQILQAGNAAEATAVLSEHQPDLILLDLMLPETSGIEILQQLRATPQTRETKVVVVSAHYQLETPHDVDGFMQKPVTSGQLLQTVQTLLN